MSIPSKTRVPIAVNRRTPLDLSCVHVTTTDFMQFNVAKVFYPVPDHSFNINHETFTRLEPLAVPTFGHAKIFNRAYFVPFRTVWTAFNDFITDTPHTYELGNTSIPSVAPYTTEGEIAKVFILPELSTEETPAQIHDPDTQFDFKLENVTTGQATLIGRRYKLTPFGRRMWKLMRTLGYSMFMNTSSTEPQRMLELLCVARVYIDNYYPAQYANDDDSSFILSLLTTNVERLNGDFFNATVISRIFRIIDNVAYANDLFVAAWDNPNSPNTGLASAVNIPDINDTADNDRTTSVKFEDSPYNSAPYLIDEQSSSLNKISQYALNALHKLSDYLKRHQIAGSRVIDRYLARFGIALSSDKLNRSYKIFEKVENLHFGDVTATADTEGTPLGSYAGKGVGYNDGSFDFKTDEYGMIVCVSTIVPDTKYYQGVSRFVKHLSRLDFWTPEFDGLGVQALGSQEVYSPVNGSSASADYGQKVFGFVPRYAEYKTPYDLITGDYILPSMNAGKDSWTLFRDLKPFVDSIGGADNLVHQFDFVNGSDADQYNRIFNYTGNEADHFNVWHKFTVKCTFPGRSLWDTYEFEDGDESRKVTMDVGGRTEN